jgi:ABC-type multidrug transport system fused ATPase/permease subunit
MTAHPIDQDVHANARSLLKPSEIFAIARRLGLPLRVFGYLLLMNLFSIAFELLAIGMLFPILEVMRAGGESAIGTLKGTHWEIMHRVSAFVGVPITLGLLLSLSFGFVILRQLLRYYAARYNHTVERSITNALRLQVFSRFLVADTTVQDQSQVGAIVPFIQVELRRALDVLLSITTSVTLIVQILAYFAALFLLSPLMSLVCAGVMALTALLVRGPMGQIKRRGATITSLNKEIVAFMIERLRHARLVRLAQTEKAEARAFNDLSQRLSREGLQQQMAAVRMQLVLEPAVIAVAYLTFFIGGHKFGISVEKLGFFAIVLIRLVPSLRSILTQYSRIVGQLPSLEALDKYMRQIRDARETKGGSRVFERLEQGIRYDHLSFTYGSSNVPALSDVSFEVPAHRMTAFVGPSGSGKSTVIDLLPRIRIPSSGTILLDGVPIDEFSTVSVRAGIAFVPQQPQIFNITAAEHIRYGKEDASIDDVREAARLAGALEFIERLPNGFDTLLGDGGKRLSGGQRQRLDIARALVRRAPILILDEPTSALDAEAEAAFRDALRSLRAGTRLTIIVIAHRLSTIADADRIVVFDQGRMAACGTHEELIASGGWYAEAFKLQMSSRMVSFSGVDQSLE